MYFDALEFLEEEREAWRPFEALDGLTDAQLDVGVAGPDRWSGRDLIGHLVAWQGYALDVARELAMGERSPTKERLDRDWDARGGEAINAAIQAEWAALPIAEVRQRLRSVPGELRGYLTVVPEIRWLKSADYLRYFLDETIDHYAEHRPDLDAILATAAGTAR
ncbi:MAG: DinB family protein [Chloroflexi bacterium]|nr:DinB family protein [Chloroflexota bacterium]